MEKHPERVIERAVKGMLPHNKLGDDMLHRLKVYAGPEHPHEAQQPEVLDISALSPKNSNYRKSKAS